MLALVVVVVVVVVVILSGGRLWWAAILLWMLLHGSAGLESGTYATKTEIIFTPNDLFVRQDGAHWRRFDRSLTHRFALQQHDKTRDEIENHDLRIRRAQARGETISPKRYYADSYHIVLQYVGHRHDLLTVYDKPRAMAVLARLKACDAEMDKAAGMGGGDPMEPKDQWGDSPGDLPGEGGRAMLHTLSLAVMVALFHAALLPHFLYLWVVTVSAAVSKNIPRVQRQVHRHMADAGRHCAPHRERRDAGHQHRAPDHSKVDRPEE